MGLFSKPATPKEVKAFARGKQSSAKAAEAYARQQEAKLAGRRANAARAAARKK